MSALAAAPPSEVVVARCSSVGAPSVASCGMSCGGALHVCLVCVCVCFPQQLFLLVELCCPLPLRPTHRCLLHARSTASIWGVAVQHCCCVAAWKAWRGQRLCAAETLFHLLGSCRTWHQQGVRCLSCQLTAVCVHNLFNPVAQAVLEPRHGASIPLVCSCCKKHAPL